MAPNSLKAVLPSLQSTKVPQEPILITENEGENENEGRMINTTHLYLTSFSSVTALIYQPPHPWGASNSPDTSQEFCIRKKKENKIRLFRQSVSQLHVLKGMLVSIFVNCQVVSMDLHVCFGVCIFSGYYPNC